MSLAGLLGIGTTMYSVNHIGMSFYRAYQRHKWSRNDYPNDKSYYLRILQSAGRRMKELKTAKYAGTILGLETIAISAIYALQ